MNQQEKSLFKKGFKLGIPIGIGYFSVSFDKADPTYDMRFGVLVILYDGAGNKIESTRFEASGKTSTYNFVKGETIYIRVVAYSSYPGENPSGLEYKLTINSVEDATWEVENRHDDNSSFADRIANAKKLTGNVLNVLISPYYFAKDAFCEEVA